MNEKRLRKVSIPAKWVCLKMVMLLYCLSLCDTVQLLASEIPLQQGKREITGKVIDVHGEPLPGTTITIDGTTSGVITDMDGTFKLEVGDKDVLVASFIGMDTQTIPVDGKTTFTIVLQEKTSELDEVTVVAFAKQKKESVISSVSTVRPSELKTPTSNLTTALGGRIAGIVSYQRSGEPGLDNAEFFIRGVTTFGYKKDPLILIDNVELTSTDLARLQVDDIATFSIMKDASATALYGARGANGVILVTTKEGREGKVQFNVRAENSFSMATKKIDIVDPVNYMKLHNEAKLTRGNPSREYSNQQIDATERGVNPYVYPAVNWYDELFKDVTSNQRVNLNLSGGGKVARYYVAGGFTKDRGVLKVDPKNNYNNNIDLQRIQIRANTNLNLTSTTELNVRVSGTFEDYTGPIYSGTQVYNMVMAANPVKFPKYYEPTPEFAYAKHSLFGNYGGEGEYLNPYAEMVRGYKDYSQSVMIAQVEFKQKLDFITEGLALRGMGSTTRDAYFNIARSYNPFYYSVGYYDKYQDKYSLTNLNPESGTDFLSTTATNADQRKISTSFYFEGVADYNRTFAEKHAVSGLLVGTMRESLESAETNDLQATLAYRNIGVSGRATYAFDSKYFFEFNFGYNGSERFSQNERFGFFPSVGAGWMASNERFWNEELKKNISKLKLKATYGLVGNDAIGDENDRFFYLSKVNLIDTDKQPISFGQDFEYRPAGVSISRYANEHITWETSAKLNLGIEIGLFDVIDIQADYFSEYRKNILMNRSSIPSTMGLQAPLRANVGEASSSGYEISIDGNHSFNKDLWVTGRANFVYTTNKFEVYDEPKYPYPWLSWVGLNMNQTTGLIAERLFIDEADIANSPRQTFGDYMPGDIKYMDVNDDGIIDSQDNVPIGYPTVPKIMYGFGLSTGYKDFDFSFFFQGSAQSSFFIDPVRTGPFLNVNPDKVVEGKKRNNAMLQAWADSYWSENNRDIYALWPRLSETVQSNNTQRSTWYMRDGSFLRLKSAELGYTLPTALSKKWNIASLRIYVSGINLLTFSKFKMWDVEMGGNGLGYPVQKVYNIGLNLSF
ncbi:TonB-linked outer membrane protein, SusC/RagA family [Porphyromonadaceae bacterium KH3CP3RA]|nr:TonB-linked outer membrane protein, SusC/RagA family [Porphyromonadaceae bacterium KH3CP3RA]